MFRTLSKVLLFYTLLVNAQSGSASGPTVTLAYGTFQGFAEGGLDKFLGIPFAQAGRFELPQTPTPFSEIQEATAFGPACPQQNFSSLSVPGLPSSAFATSGAPSTVSEDCLFVNVIAPSNIPPGTELPILFWIFGGGFEDGDTSVNDGSPVVARSIALGEPVIYVSANYRLNGFGFAASKEIKAAGIGNLGLRDRGFLDYCTSNPWILTWNFEERFAMQWVQTNIGLFGGDKTRVTIWGESAGAISVASHLVVNGGNQEGLFHGAFMESGSPVPMTDITAGQPFFDQLAANTGCSGSPDVLTCLKSVPFQTFLNAVNLSPNLLGFMSLQLAWLPRVDGDFITENPQDSLVKGAFSNIPFANGDCDDEGTLFSLSQLNLTTPEEGENYLHSNYYPGASDAQFAPVIALYPSDPTVGSPFGTGDANQLTPQFKRIAAFQGDGTFQAPRRFFLKIASKRQNVWSFRGLVFKRGKTTPFLGTFHGSDLPEFYSSSATPDFQGTDALVNFANTGNPNNGAKNNISTLIHWPMYSTNVEAPPLLTFLDPNVLEITEDTFRVEPIQALENLSREFP